MNFYNEALNYALGKKPLHGNNPLESNKRPFYHNYNTTTNEDEPLILNPDRHSNYQNFGGFRIPGSLPYNKAAIGVPGSGKTQLIYQTLASVLENIRRDTMNCCICLDTKRDLLPTLSYYAKKNNVPLIYYDLNDERGFDWNLVADTKGDIDRIHEISEAFISASKDPIWGQGARLINDAILLSCIHEKGLNATLHDLYETAHSPLTELTTAISRSPHGRVYAKRLLETSADEFRDSLMMNHFVEIECLRKGAIHSFFTPQNQRFTIQDILTQPCIVLISCDVQVEHSAFPLMRAFLANLITQVRALPDLKYSPYPERRISLFLDELHAIGKVPNLDKAFSTGRSKGLEITMSFHDMAQLRKVYDDATVKNITNCLDFIAMHRTTDPETAEWFVKRGGMERITEVTTTRSTDAKGASYSEAEKTGDRTRFTADDILYLPKADPVNGSKFVLFHPYEFPMQVCLTAAMAEVLAPLEDLNCPIFIPKSEGRQSLKGVRQIKKPSQIREDLETWVKEAKTPLDQAIRLHALTYLNNVVDENFDDLLAHLK
jgi:hypothetical protein